MFRPLLKLLETGGPIFHYLMAMLALLGVVTVVNGWMAVETYLRGRRDGRAEATAKPAPLDYEGAESEC
jgi:hypothetical protein